MSNLVIRIEGNDEIGLAGADYKIRVIERLRELGFHALGAESLVFDKDESHRAAFRLGGIVRELDCWKPMSGVRCRLGVEWQLLDVERDVVVYKAVIRSVVLDVPFTRIATVGSRLLIGSLESLTQRPRFRSALSAGEAAEPTATDPQLPPATFAACAPLSKRMPEGAEQVLRAAVVVKSGSGFGSGFFITSDGLLLTAAHVLDGSPAKIRMRDGTEVDAVPVRVAKHADVALMRPARPLTAPGCIVPSSRGDPAIGSELYAVGTPASVSLAFSLTRGIVSSVRDFEGHHVLQTDAPVNQGNSGGPMLDADGFVVAISNAKLTGRAVEGIAFGVPTGSALRALSLRAGSTTDPSLSTGTSPAPSQETSAGEALTDNEDPVPSLDPEGDARRARAAAEAAAEAERSAAEADRLRAERLREEEEGLRDQHRKDLRDAQTPTYVKALYWGGMSLGIVGGIAAVGSYRAYDAGSTTHAEYDRLALFNTLGWSAFGLGAGAFAASLYLRPPMPEFPEDTAPASSQVVLAPGSISWQGSF